MTVTFSYGIQQIITTSILLSMFPVCRDNEFAAEIKQPSGTTINVNNVLIYILHWVFLQLIL